MFNKIQNLIAVKLLFFTILGFIFQKFFHLSFISFDYYIIILVSFILISFLLKNYIIFVFIVFFYLGVFSSFKTNNLDYKYNGNFPPELNAIFRGEIKQKLKSTENISRYLVQGELTTVGLYTFPACNVHLTVIKSDRDNKNYEDNKNNEGDKIFCTFKFRLPNTPTLPNEFNEKNYYRTLGADFTAYTYSNNLTVFHQNKNTSIKQKIKNSVSNQIDKLYSKVTAGIVKALLLADKSNIPLEIKRSFSLSGTAHILAVSGLHVGLIAAILFWFFSFIKLDFIKFPSFLLFLWGYIYLIDFQPSAVRAGIMITLYTLTKMLQRKAEPLNIVALTILIILIVNPNSIYSAGFQMSIASITGIYLLYSPLYNFFSNILNLKKFKFINKYILTSLSLTFAASIIVSPIVAYYFGIYSLISPITNIFVVFLMVYALIFAIPSVFLSYLIFPLAQLFANSSQLLIEISELITYYSIKIPWAYLEGQNIFLISVLISTAMLYLFTSKFINQFAFRTIVVFLIIIAFYFFPYQKNLPFNEFDRPTSKLVEFPNKNILIIIDKKNNVSNRYDYGLLRYILDKKDSCTIYYDGQTAILLQNKMNNPSNFRWIKISDDVRKLIYQEISKFK